MEKTILVIDDNMVNRKVLAKILSQRYQVIEAVNGQDGLNRLEARKTGVDAIMLDVVMPVMDGYDFLGWIKNHQDYRNIPIFVTSFKNSLATEQRALELGACDFISKPYQPEIIHHRIANVLETQALLASLQCDYLTGLSSRDYFINQYTTIQGKDHYWMVDVTIKNFDCVNKHYGYEYGMMVLKKIGQIIAMSGSAKPMIASRMDRENFILVIDESAKPHQIVGTIVAKTTALMPNVEIATASLKIKDHDLPLFGLVEKLRITTIETC